MASTYWHRHPRGFANECSIVRCETPEEKKYSAAFGYARINRKDLRSHVAWINAENESWGSSRAFGKISFESILKGDEYRCALPYLNPV